MSRKSGEGNPFIDDQRVLPAAASRGFRGADLMVIENVHKGEE